MVLFLGIYIGESEYFEKSFQSIFINVFIEKELENIFDIKIRVKFKTVDIEKSKSELDTGNNPKTSQEDDKVFDKIVDLFDGEIIH